MWARHIIGLRFLPSTSITALVWLFIRLAQRAATREKVQFTASRWTGRQEARRNLLPGLTVTCRFITDRTLPLRGGGGAKVSKKKLLTYLLACCAELRSQLLEADEEASR